MSNEESMTTEERKALMHEMAELCNKKQINEVFEVVTNLLCSLMMRLSSNEIRLHQLNETLNKNITSIVNYQVEMGYYK